MLFSGDSPRLLPSWREFSARGGKTYEFSRFFFTYFPKCGIIKKISTTGGYYAIKGLYGGAVRH